MFPAGIDLVVAGPPCQPFSTASRNRGLEDPRSKALLNVARLIHYLHHTQPFGVSCIIENVPGTDKHLEIQRMLSDPVWLDAPPYGSGAHRETLQRRSLHYPPPRAPSTTAYHERTWVHGAPCHATPPPPSRLSEKKATVYPPPPPPPDIALPKFVCYKGSHAFRIKRGLPGPGMLYHEDVLREPDSRRVRALLLGFHPDDIADPGLSEDQRCHLLGQCIDINLFSWSVNTVAPASTHYSDLEEVPVPPSLQPTHLPPLPLSVMAPGSFDSNRIFSSSQPRLLPSEAPPPPTPHSAPLDSTIRPGELDIHRRLLNRRGV